MRYTKNKWIFRTAFALVIILFASMIYINGIGIFQQQTTIHCPDTAYEPCKMMYSNKSYFTMRPGETRTFNQHEAWKVKLLNYGTTTIVLTSLILNHLLYNRKYSFKKEILAKIKK